MGSSLAARLVRDGHRVWGLRREAAAMPKGVSPLEADLVESDLERLLPPGLEQVVFAAATGGGPDDAYHRLFQVGLTRLVEALVAGGHPVRRFVFVSSTGVYGQRDGEWVDESSPTRPTMVSGRAMLKAESAVAATPWTSVIVRFAGIYGPGRIRLIRSVRDRDDPLRLSAAPRYLNQIHRDDCVGVLSHVMGISAPLPVYLAVDHEPAPRLEVLRWIATRSGLPYPEINEASPDPYPGDGRGNKRCRNHRLLDAGYQFRFPTYREGYDRLIQDEHPRIRPIPRGE